MGSIPTRSRHGRGTSSLLLLLSLGISPPRLAAQQQDSARAGAGRPAREPREALVRRAADARPPVSPRRAFLYSFMLPGFGQTALDRPTAGAFFFTIEAIALGMAGKSFFDLREARRFAGDSVPPILRFTPDSLGRVARDPRTGAARSDSSTNRYRGSPSIVASRRTHLEDWLAVILFNHLISGADALVAAHLWDLPGEVQLRLAPGRAFLQFRFRR